MVLTWVRPRNEIDVSVSYHVPLVGRVGINEREEEGRRAFSLIRRENSRGRVLAVPSRLSLSLSCKSRIIVISRHPLTITRVFSDCTVIRWQSR